MTAGEVGDFTKLLQDAPVHAAVLIILVFLVLVWVKQGFSRLVEPVYFRRNRRRELLDAYLAAHGNDGTAPEMLAVMADMRDALYFYEATGIHADKKWRGRLVKLHEQTPPTVSWRTIRYAKEFLRPNGTDGLVVPPLNRFEQAAMMLTAAMALLLFVLWADYLYALESTFQQIIATGGADKVASLALAGLMLTAAFSVTIRSFLPYQAARKIRKELASPAP